MASINELKDVLKESLEDQGVLPEIRARIRASIFQILNDQNPARKNLSNENLIINEMIREYLKFNNYMHTLSVFIPETGQPEKPAFDRDYITKKIGVKEDASTKEYPLLYSLAFGLKEMVVKGGGTISKDAGIKDNVKKNSGKEQGMPGYNNRDVKFEDDYENQIQNRSIADEIFPSSDKPIIYNRKR